MAETLRALARIADIGHSIQNTLRPHLRGTVAQDTTPIPSISLARPCAIRETLLQLGCSDAVAEDVSRMYLLKAEQLRSATEEKIQQLCANLVKVQRPTALQPLPELLQEIVAVFTAKFARSLMALENTTLSVMERKMQLLREKQEVVAEKKWFNRDFLPFLEEYFKHNAFPCAADRQFMADKSGMTPRQIEVWFQNHRRRAKAENRAHELKRAKRFDPIPEDLDLASMEKAMLSTWIVPAHLRQVVESDDELDDAVDSEEEQFEAALEKTAALENSNVELKSPSVPEMVDLSDALGPNSPPPHAFPTTFQESRTMPSIILPITPFYFPKPQWRRTAATKPVVSTQPLPTIDELAKMVESRLHVHDSTQGLSAASPFFETPFTFRALRAPLPSLVTRKVSVAPVQPTTAVNTTNARRSKGSKGANASKQLAAAAGPSTSPTSSRKEKKPSLPRRTPKRAPKRNPSPALSDSSSRSVSSSPLSRTPSLEFSFSPSSSRITSTATTTGSPPSRSSSIGPTTPIDTTVSLPFVAGADFREMAFDPMFGNPVFPTDVVVAKPPLNLPPPLPSSLALPTP